VRLRLGGALVVGDGPTGLVRFDAGPGRSPGPARINAGDLGCLAGAHGFYEAGELSVSIATVDRVLSGRTIVRESTAARVQAAVQALGYQFAGPMDVRLGGIFGQVFGRPLGRLAAGLFVQPLGVSLSKRDQRLRCLRRSLKVTGYRSLETGSPCRTRGHTSPYRLRRRSWPTGPEGL